MSTTTITDLTESYFEGKVLAYLFASVILGFIYFFILLYKIYFLIDNDKEDNDKEDNYKTFKLSVYFLLLFLFVIQFCMYFAHVYFNRLLYKYKSTHENRPPPDSDNIPPEENEGEKIERENYYKHNRYKKYCYNIGMVSSIPFVIFVVVSILISDS